MDYIRPDQVTSPQDYVSNVRVLHEGPEDSFSLAIIEWEGEDCFAIRWNVARREWDDPEKINETKQCVGMPSSHGYPVWFVLPNEMINPTSAVWKIIDKNKRK